MNKNQNGVTITILVVTIIVFAIILGVTISVSTELLSDTKLKSYISEMLLVQSKAKSIGETLNFEGILGKTDADSRNKIIALGLEGKVGNKFNGNGRLNNDKHKAQVSNIAKSGTASSLWYIWDANVLKANGFDPQMLAEGQYYIVNLSTGEIIYSQGFTPLTDRSNVLFSLQSMLDYN